MGRKARIYTGCDFLGGGVHWLVLFGLVGPTRGINPN